MPNFHLIVFDCVLRECRYVDALVDGADVVWLDEDVGEGLVWFGCKVDCENDYGENVIVDC